MGLNTQFPEWMQRATDSNRQAGAQLGQNILQGLRFREGVKQQALENRNLSEMQDAQLLIQQSNANIARLQSQQAALASENAVKANNSMAEALALSADIAGSPNGYNPGNQARFYNFVANNPALAQTPWFKSEEERFKTANDYRMKAEELETNLAGRAMIAESGNRNSSAMNDARTRVQSMVERGEILPEEADAKVEEMMALKDKTAFQKNTQFSVEAALDAGFKGDPSKIKAIAAANNGRIPNLSENTELKLADRAAVIELTDTVLDKIDKFNALYGKDAIDSYVGQFDVPFDRALDAIRKRTGKKDMDALDIIQSFEDARTGKMKSTSGATITTAEQNRLDRVIGTTLNKNFVNALKTFNRNDRSAFNTVIESFSDRIVPENLKRIASGSSPSTTPATDKATDTNRVVRLPATNRFRKGTTVIQNGVKYTFE